MSNSSPAVTVEALPVGRGDCLWIECAGDERPWRLLIDGGLPSSWPTLRSRIERLPPGDRHIDVAIVSHIDADHIGGMLALLIDNTLGVTLGDVWFNGPKHLPDDDGRTRSVRQGESLLTLLSGAGEGGFDAPPWNKAFDGGAVMCGPDGSHRAVPPDPERPDGPTLTVIGPPPKRLRRLITVWDAELNRVRAGTPSVDDLPATAPESLDDLEGLATTKTSSDRSVPNGSSIAVLLEHRGVRCVLTGDAFVKDLTTSLAGIAVARGLDRLPVDLFKLSHHGSRGNISRRLVQLAPADHYLVSTNGDRFRHPDDIAMARVITAARPGVNIWFNHDTPDLRRWHHPDLRAKHHYETHYPTDRDAGARLELEGRQ